MTTIERQFAFHVAGLRAEDLPQAALEATGRLFLDTVAAMLSGFANRECRTIVERLVGTGTTGRCSVVGRPRGVDAATAALANGIYAHWCEWDDVHDEAGIHGSAVIFPALLAAAEQAGTDGRTEASGAFAAAVVASYDVAARIGAALNAKAAHGWMTTGAAATIGAAGGAARLLGLDPAGILSAMGIAATGGGLSRQPLVDPHQRQERPLWHRGEERDRRRSHGGSRHRGRAEFLLWRFRHQRVACRRPGGTRTRGSRTALFGPAGGGESVSGLPLHASLDRSDA